ncbi:MAG: divalent-cation tolerance protein CutA [Candidatus Omnitrophica bacterium]|nr:divalent-cation tolerance protein CutA [Candidatus Omnitrophota bacterium]
MPAVRYITIFITASSRKEAEKIALSLLKKRLVACANIFGGVDSIFSWKGKIDKAEETLIILKTKRNLFKKIVLEVKKIHSYKTPEIIAAPIIEGSKDYLEWINRNTQ